MKAYVICCAGVVKCVVLKDKQQAALKLLDLQTIDYQNRKEVTDITQAFYDYKYPWRLEIVEAV